MPSLPPELVNAQRELAALSDDELSDRLADTMIALAYRIQVTPTEVLESAFKSIGFTDEQWVAEVRPALEEALTDA